RSDAPLASGPEQHLELGGNHRLELSIGARLGRPIGPPAEEVCRVSKPRALQVVVADLHHSLDPHRLPGEILLVVPPARRARHPLLALAGHARPVLPGMALEPSVAKRLQLGLELLALGSGEAGADAHVWSAPCSSCSPRRNEPTPPPPLHQRTPATTQSAVRSC